MAVSLDFIRTGLATVQAGLHRTDRERDALQRLNLAFQELLMLYSEPAPSEAPKAVAARSKPPRKPRERRQLPIEGWATAETPDDEGRLLLAYRQREHLSQAQAAKRFGVRKSFLAIREGEVPAVEHNAVRLPPGPRAACQAKDGHPYTRGISYDTRNDMRRGQVSSGGRIRQLASRGWQTCVAKFEALKREHGLEKPRPIVPRPAPIIERSTEPIRGTPPGAPLAHPTMKPARVGTRATSSLARSTQASLP